MKGILNFINPDKISFYLPPPSLGRMEYSSFKDRIRFYCFVAVMEIILAIPCILIVLLLKGIMK